MRALKAINKSRCVRLQVVGDKPKWKKKKERMYSGKSFVLFLWKIYCNFILSAHEKENMSE